MKRIDKPDAILTSDWHLREDQPICRTDDFWETQWRKITFIRELQAKHNCSILNAGDLFNHWKPSPRLFSATIMMLPKAFHTIYGQHDLPQHNMSLSEKSGVYTLKVAGMLKILSECHWNQKPHLGSMLLPMPERKILVWHKMVYLGEKPFPKATAPPALALLEKYPQFDLIVTGDNHKPFTFKHEGRLLVNPGSIFRLTADQIDHKPRVYLWYAETNTVKEMFLPIEEGVISREHIEQKEQRNDRIDAFITGLNKDWKTARTFKDNLQHFESTNRVRKDIMEIIYKAIEQ